MLEKKINIFLIENLLFLFMNYYIYIYIYIYYEIIIFKINVFIQKIVFDIRIR